MRPNNESLLKLHAGLKLQIELVPGSCFYSNVRSILKKGQWDEIRRAVYGKFGNKCAICGGVGPKWPVECHEVWMYDDVALTQTLGYMQALCPACHHVKHMGLHPDSFSRFVTFNGLDRSVAVLIRQAVFKQHSARSRKEWGLNVGHLATEYGIEVDGLDLSRKKIITPGERFVDRINSLIAAEDALKQRKKSK